jgi:hypothetical protein
MQNSALIIAAQPATAKPERQGYECGQGIGKAQLRIQLSNAVLTDYNGSKFRSL